MTAYNTGVLGSRKSSGWHVLDLARIASRTLAAVRAAHERSRQRAYLADLPDYRLEDIGLTRGQVIAESGKPFWIA